MIFQWITSNWCVKKYIAFELHSKQILRAWFMQIAENKTFELCWLKTVMRDFHCKQAVTAECRGQNSWVVLGEDCYVRVTLCKQAVIANCRGQTSWVLLSEDCSVRMSLQLQLSSPLTSWVAGWGLLRTIQLMCSVPCTICIVQCAVCGVQHVLCYV